MKKMRLLTPVLACLLSFSATAIDHKFYGNQIIVKFKDSGKARVMNAGTLRALSDSAQVKLAFKRTTGGGARVLFLDQASSPEEMEKMVLRLQNRSDVEYAEVDYKRYPAVFPVDAPDDEFFAAGEQWYLQDNSAASNRGAINVEAVWKMGVTGKGVTIAVVDTGFTPHPDLGSNIIKGFDFVSLDPDGSSSTDADGTPGRDSNADDPGDAVTQADKDNIDSFKNDDNCSPSTKIEGVHQSSWHGTLVSGVLGALTDNAIGIAGSAPGATILLSRALGKCGGYNSDLMDATRWSAGLSVTGVPINTAPAKIINLSLGGGGACSNMEQEAITAVTNAGSIVVVAAGNEGKPASDSAPGNCLNAFNVASNTRWGGESSYTNFGPEIAISAPGGSNAGSSDDRIKAPVITTTQTPVSGTGPISDTSNAAYEGVQGTSFSAPIVSGIIAMMLEVKPDLTPAQISSLLTANVTPFPTNTVLNATDGTGDSNRDCTTAKCGAGIINAKKVIDAIQGDSIPAATPTASGGGAMHIIHLLLLGLFGFRKTRMR